MTRKNQINILKSASQFRIDGQKGQKQIQKKQQQQQQQTDEYDNSQLKFENDLYKSVKLLLILSQIFICAPTFAHRQPSTSSKSPAQQNDAPDYSVRRDRLLIILHIIWFLLIYFFLFTLSYSEYTESNIDLPTVQKPLYFGEYLVYLVHTFQIILATYYGRQKFRQFICTIINFDQLLLGFDVQPNYKLIRKFLEHHLLLILLHLTCTLIISYFYSAYDIRSFLRTSTVYILPNIILHVTLIQYYGLLYTISIRSTELNRVLESQIAKHRFHPFQLHLSLHRIRLLYTKLQIFMQDINDAFAPSILLIYVGSFINISVNIFLIYKYMDDTEKSDLAWIMYSLAWTAMHIGKMFLILYHNHCFQQQKNITAELLSELKGTYTEMDATISHFILQLIINTRSNVICGFIVLNLDFITSLLVAISTLFIFLLQYDITFEALTKTQHSANPKN